MDLCDKAVIISGDSDLVPAIEMVKEHYPKKIIEVLVPPGRKAKKIERASDQIKTVKRISIYKSYKN